MLSQVAFLVWIAVWNLLAQVGNIDINCSVCDVRCTGQSVLFSMPLGLEHVVALFALQHICICLLPGVLWFILLDGTYKFWKFQLFGVAARISVITDQCSEYCRFFAIQKCFLMLLNKLLATALQETVHYATY